MLHHINSISSIRLTDLSHLSFPHGALFAPIVSLLHLAAILDAAIADDAGGNDDVNDQHNAKETCQPMLSQLCCLPSVVRLEALQVGVLCIGHVELLRPRAHILDKGQPNEYIFVVNGRRHTLHAHHLLASPECELRLLARVRISAPVEHFERVVAWKLLVILDG